MAAQAPPAVGVVDTWPQEVGGAVASVAVQGPVVVQAAVGSGGGGDGRRRTCRSDQWRTLRPHTRGMSAWTQSSRAPLRARSRQPAGSPRAWRDAMCPSDPGRLAGPVPATAEHPRRWLAGRRRAWRHHLPPRPGRRCDRRGVVYAVGPVVLSRFADHPPRSLRSPLGVTSPARGRGPCSATSSQGAWLWDAPSPSGQPRLGSPQPPTLWRMGAGGRGALGACPSIRR